MKSSEKNNSFLKGKSKADSFSQHHQKELGLDIPDNYFTTSKNAILDLVMEKKQETPVFYLRRSFQVAASIAALIFLTIIFQFNSNDDSEIFVASDDVLIESLFVEDNSVNDFLDDVLVSDVVIEAEKSEQELENVLINSLFVEDTLVEDYTKKSLLDNVVL